MHRTKKIFFSTIGGILLLAIAFFAFLPSLLSTSWGTQKLISYLENRLDATLTIDHLSLSWFSGQQIKEMTFDKRSLHCHFTLLQTECSFWNLLRQSGNIGQTSLVEPTLIFQSLPEKQEQSHQTFWKHFRGDLKIERGKLALNQSDLPPLSIQVTDFEVSTTPSEVSLSGKGTTAISNQAGTFFVNIAQKGPQWQGSAKLENFPIGTLQALMSPFLSKVPSLVLQSLGTTLDLSLTAQPEETATLINVNLQSPSLTRISHQTLGKLGTSVSPNIPSDSLENVDAHCLREPLEILKKQVVQSSSRAGERYGLTATLACRYGQNTLTLTRASRIEWTLPPSFFNELSAHFSLPLQLTESTTLICNLTAAQIDKNTFRKRGFFDSRGTLSLGRTSLNVAGNPLTLQLFVAGFETVKTANTASLTLSSQLRDRSLPETTLRASAKIADAWGKKPHFTQLNATIQNGPLPLIDRWRSSSPALTPWLGTTIDLELDWLKAHHLEVAASTPLATLAKTSFSLDQAIELKAPTTFSYRLPMQQHELLTAPVAFSGTMTTLKIPLTRGDLDWQKSFLSLNLTTNKVALKDFSSLGALTLTAFACELKSQDRGKSHLQLSSTLNFASNTTGNTFLGPNGQLNLTGLIDWRSNFTAESLQLSLNSASFNTEMAGTLAHSTFELTQPTDIHFELPPAWINPILKEQGSDLTLTKKAPVTATLKTASFPLSQQERSSWQLEAVIKSPALPLLATRNAHTFTLENATCSFSRATTQNVRLQAVVTEKNAPAGDLLLTWKNGRSNEWEIKLTQFSTTLVDALINGRGHLPAIIGPTLNLDAQSSLNQHQGKFALDLTSDYLTIESGFIRADNALSNRHEPLNIEWKMTDSGFNALRQLRDPNQNAPLFAIEGTANVSSRISHLSLPLKKEKTTWPIIDWNLYQTTFDANLNINQLNLKPAKATSTHTSLDELEIELIKKTQGSKLSFDLTGALSTSEGKKGTLQATGHLNNAITTTGTLEPKDLTASMRATIKAVPTLALDALIQLFLAHAAAPSLFLGKTTSASLDVAIDHDQGSIDADLSATACKARFVGAVNQGVISLKRPLEATLTITPELNARLAQSAAVEVVSLSEPITLYIDPNGFAVPLADLHLRSTQLKYGRLNLHQVVCRNQGSASDLSEIFKLNPFQSSLISLWFAPMEFRIARGIMSIDRTEILYNRAYQVALWGNIDYHERFVSMMLGLTAQSLQAALNIRDLSPNYVLAIPIRGPFGNVKLDKGAATSKIGFLIARKQIAPRAGTWGSLFGAIGDLADDQSNIPPAKPPFPWQN